MKTTKSQSKKNTESGLLVSPVELAEKTETKAAETTTAPAQVVETPEAEPAKRILPYVNFQQRDANRSLSTDEVLRVLREYLPEQLPLAEVVGKWVWITFGSAPAEIIRGQLSQLGFHWNNHRKCWQHPCGQFATEGSGQDPRTKYGTRMAA
jgi:hypothetical protein